MRVALVALTIVLLVVAARLWPASDHREALFPQPFPPDVVAQARDFLQQKHISGQIGHDGQILWLRPVDIVPARAHLTSAVLPRLTTLASPKKWTKSDSERVTRELEAVLQATEGVADAEVMLKTDFHSPSVPEVQILLEFQAGFDARKLGFGIRNITQALVPSTTIESVKLLDRQGRTFDWMPVTRPSRSSDLDLIELLSGEASSRLETELEEKLKLRVSVQMSGAIRPRDHLPPPTLALLTEEVLALFRLSSLSLAAAAQSEIPALGSLETEYEARLLTLSQRTKLEKRSVWLLHDGEEDPEAFSKAEKLAENLLKLDATQGETLQSSVAEFLP